MAEENEQPIPIWPILALDPGGTTGYAAFTMYEILDASEVVGDAATMEALIKHFSPSIVVIEEYRIYPGKAKTHIHSDVPTARLIGAIEYICQKLGIPVVKQGAGMAKGFCDNDKLRAWGMYKVGYGHARDAIRHGAYYLIFGHKKNGTRRHRAD